MTPQEEEADACAQVLIELAFLLPKGTDLQKHPIANKLRRWVVAIRQSAQRS